MTDFTSWQNKIVPEGQSLLSLERPVEGTSTTYPLLSSVSQLAETTERRTWSVRVVLNSALSESKMTALAESVEDVRVRSSEPEDEVLESLLRVEKRGAEARIWTDLLMLRNLAEIQRLQSCHPEIEIWTLVTVGSSDEDPEHLVGETIRQLTGVLAGCRFLELRQGVGESFQSLWGRVNVSRLMASEGELQALQDPLSGTPFFEELRDRLS